MARQCGEALLHLSMLAQRARGACANGPVIGSGWLVRAHFAVKSVRSMHGGPAVHSMPVGSASSARARGRAQRGRRGARAQRRDHHRAAQVHGRQRARDDAPLLAAQPLRVRAPRRRAPRLSCGPSLRGEPASCGPPQHLSAPLRACSGMPPVTASWRAAVTAPAIEDPSAACNQSRRRCEPQGMHGGSDESGRLGPAQPAGQAPGCCPSQASALWCLRCERRL